MDKNEIITSELDKVLDLIQNEKLKSQRFEQYHKIFKSSYNKNYNIHNKKRKCSIPGCNNMSIKRSHSIPKSSSLDSIATNGNLLYPEMNINSKTLSVKMVEVGKKHASTFPGYCVQHENLFSTFEESGQIRTIKDIGLQSFRAINREAIFRECEIEIQKEEVAEYKNQVEIEATEILKENIKVHGIDPNSIIKSIEFGLNDQQITIRESLIDYEQGKINILKSITKEIFEDLPDLKKHTCCSIMIDIVLPVALSGFTNFKIKDPEKDIYIVMNVIPSNYGTYITLLVNAEHSHVLEYITKRYFENELRLIGFIENIMMHGSDHWFINPKYWNSFDLNKQDRILSHILQINKTIIEDYEYSIFDDIKISIIEEYEGDSNSEDANIQEIVRDELLKIKNSENWKKMDEKELSTKIAKQYLGK